MPSSTTTRRRHRRQTLTLAGYVLFGAIIVVPLLWLVLASLMTRLEITSRPQVYLPSHPQWNNYLSFFRQGLIGNESTSAIAYGLRNSLIVCSAVTILNVVLGAPAAYTIARIKFRGSGALLAFYLATRTVPTISLMVPLYILFRSLHLLNTITGLVLVYLPYTLPFTIWLLLVYIRLLPRELDDAALVDGCSRVQALYKVILPVAKPALTSAALFAFVSAWSEFILAVILTSTTAAETITVAAGNFGNDIYTDYNLLAASAVVALIPPVLLALVFQKHIIGGLARGVRG